MTGVRKARVRVTVPAGAEPPDSRAIVLAVAEQLGVSPSAAHEQPPAALAQLHGQLGQIWDEELAGLLAELDKLAAE